MSSSSVSPDISENPNPINPHHAEGESSEIPISPQDVEENNVNQENPIPENIADEDYDADDEEDEEESDEEESVNMPPPPRTSTGLRIRFVVRPTTGMLALPVPAASAASAAPPVPPSLGAASSSSYIPTPTYDPYHPPGFSPLPTFPWLAREIESQERRLQNIEEIIDSYPDHYQMEGVLRDVYHIKHAILELQTRLPIVAEEKFYGDRISKLEDSVDKLKAQMDAMQFMMAEIYKNQK